MPIIKGKEMSALQINIESRDFQLLKATYPRNGMMSQVVRILINRHAEKLRAKLPAINEEEIKDELNVSIQEIHDTSDVPGGGREDQGTISES